MIEEAIKRAIEGGSMLYNPKQCCPDGERDRELRWIYHLAEIAPDGPAVEIGIGTGGTMRCWAMAREERGDLIAIDIVLPPTCFGDFDILITLPSTQAVEYVPTPLAFCFVDGDHTEEGIRDDITIWSDKIMPGGVLAFHDYGSYWESAVKEAVDEWQDKAQWELLGQVGSLIAFRRPDDNDPGL